jgi:hypothetical protein
MVRQYAVSGPSPDGSFFSVGSLEYEVITIKRAQPTTHKKNFFRQNTSGRTEENIFCAFAVTLSSIFIH